MIRKIQLENFMAHKATSIELSPGVTVITGPNNIGKSAIVEAIRHLVYNPAPKNVIRHGAKKAVVRLELDSGEIITWQRQDKNASYSIQRPSQEDASAVYPPEEYHKFGRAVPDDVRSLLRLEQVETDTDNLDIHLGNQRQPIFLLDRPGSHAAGFFAASTEADYLIKMQQALKRRIDLANATKKRLITELAAIAQQLEQYEPLDDLEDQIKLTEFLYADVIETKRQLPLLADIISQMLEAQTQLAVTEHSESFLSVLKSPPALQDITRLALILSELGDKTRLRRREASRTVVFTDLTSPPALAATAALEFLLAQSRATQNRYAGAKVKSGVLTDLTAPPVTAEVEELPGLIQTLTETMAKTEGLQGRQTILARQVVPPLLYEVSLLNDVVGELDRENDHYGRLQRLTHLMGRILPPPETIPVLALENSLTALMQGTTDFSRQQNHLAVLTGQLDQKKAEIQNYLLDTGLCPLCGSPLDLEHFLETRHV